MNDKQQREADAQRAQQQQQQTGLVVPPPVDTMVTALQLGVHHHQKLPPSKARPSTPPTMKDWVIPRAPNGYIFQNFQSMPDSKGNSEFITSAWMDERDHFLLSIVQGPAAKQQAHWDQHLGHSI